MGARPRPRPSPSPSPSRSPSPRLYSFQRLRFKQPGRARFRVVSWSVQLDCRSPNLGARSLGRLVGNPRARRNLFNLGARGFGYLVECAQRLLAPLAQLVETVLRGTVVVGSSPPRRFLRSGDSLIRARAVASTRYFIGEGSVKNTPCRG